MSVLVELPDRDRLEVVLVEREGLGWAIGIGRLMARGIERERSTYLAERDAMRAALVLADRRDLLALRVESGEAVD